MAALSPLSQGSALTPPDLIQLPRPGTASANVTGTLALWPSSAFSFAAADGDGRTAKSIYLVDLKSSGSSSSGSSTTTSQASAPREILSDLVYNEAVWVDANNFLFLRPPTEVAEVAEHAVDGRRADHPRGLSDKDQKARVKANAAKAGGAGVELWAKDVSDEEEYLITTFPVVINSLKAVQVKTSKEQGAILSFSAEVYPDGDISKVAEHDQEQEAAARGSDIKVYDSTFVRHWDEWSPTAGQKNQLFFVRLTRSADALAPQSDDDYEHVTKAELADAPLPPGRWQVQTRTAEVEGETVKKAVIKAPLAGTALESPVRPFGGADDFDISATHIAFHAKDPHLNGAWHTRTNVYLVPLSPKSKQDALPKAVTIGTQGACSSPVFSADGSRLAWLEMREDGYEADRNRIMIYEIATGQRWGASEKWDRSPGHLHWCPCGEKLFLTAEENARVKLFELAVPIPHSSASVAEIEAKMTVEPTALTHEHAVAGFEPLTPTSLLLTMNSMTHPNELSLVNIAPVKKYSSADEPPPAVSIAPLSTLAPHVKEKKLLDKGESFTFAGAEGVSVQGWILFPPELKDPQARKGKKLPLAFLVHGGPEGSWADNWSTRWNPNVFASAGFVTVAINPSGSTGFGEEFTRSIRGSWGGKPFQDLVAGLEFVKQAYPEIDSSRMTALGASYGGYMMNWMMGKNDRLGFKAFVIHDGVFSTKNVWYTTEELYFPEKEFGGTPYEVPDEYSKWDPQNHVQKWNTPALVIHGSRDYRLTESEGLGVFNALQRLGVPSRLAIFPSENHWVLSPHNGRAWHEQVLGWIKQWTALDGAGSA